MITKRPGHKIVEHAPSLSTSLPTIKEVFAGVFYPVQWGIVSNPRTARHTERQYTVRKTKRIRIRFMYGRDVGVIGLRIQ